MKIRFFAALLVAALSITVLSGCAVAATPAPTEAPATPAPAAPSSPSRITKEEAIAIALKDAGLTEDQVKMLRAEFDYDEGRPAYDVDFRQGNYEYDYEIHAETGRILSRDKDRDD